MTDQPLQPFSPPTALFTSLQLPALSPGLILEGVLLLGFALWAIYTLVAVYHWLRFSHASLVMFPAIGVHLSISFALLTYILTGNGIL